MARPRSCGHDARRKGRCYVCTLAYDRKRKRLERPRFVPAKTRTAIKERRYSDRLTQGYVRKMLSRGTGKPSCFWPKDLVALKRQAIKLHRKLCQAH